MVGQYDVFGHAINIRNFLGRILDISLSLIPSNCFFIYVFVYNTFKVGEINSWSLPFKKLMSKSKNKNHKRLSIEIIIQLTCKLALCPHESCA